MKTLMLVAALAGTLAAAPAAFAFPDTVRFTHEATGFKVIKRGARTGNTVLTGTNANTGESFKVRVTASGRVIGTYKGQPVDFQLDKTAKAAAL
jgi:hypothetical protein